VLLLLLVLPRLIYPILAVDILSWGLFALAFDLVFGYAGLLSFGHAMFWGTSASVPANVLLRTGLPVPVALLIGTVAALVRALRTGAAGHPRQPYARAERRLPPARADAGGVRDLRRSFGAGGRAAGGGTRSRLARRGALDHLGHRGDDDAARGDRDVARSPRRRRARAALAGRARFQHGSHGSRDRRSVRDHGALLPPGR